MCETGEGCRLLTLDELKPGQRGVLTRVRAEGALRQRLFDLGLTPGVEVTMRRAAPLGDPLSIRLRGYDLAIRRREARLLELERSRSAPPVSPARGDAPPARTSPPALRPIPEGRARPRPAGGLVLALAGNPNCGKTTLFNALTGSRQYVGNWPGVTVEKVSARTRAGRSELVDLPGIYSLSPWSLEEGVARDFLLGQGGERPDAILNILDGSNLERNLSLTLQLLELGLPVVVAVNMMDEVQKRGWTLDCDRLSQELGVPVIPISARSGQGLDRLLEEVEAAAESGIPAPAPALPTSAPGGEPDAAGADARFARIGEIAAACLRRPGFGKPTLTDRIDAVVTGRLTALPVFLLLLGGTFAMTFGGVGRFFSRAVELLFSRLLTPALQELLARTDAPEWCGRLLLEGVLGGVSSVLVFLPQIAILFLCLSLLEDSGYMARAAFLMDRPMRRIGLTGRAFIPMLMGFGCTTPAVMAARGLDNERDRRLTILLTPFMSCSARLPIYAMFAGTFFAGQQGILLAGLYLLGIFAAIGAGGLLQRTVLRGTPAPFLLELPPYRMPSLLAVTRHVWEKVRGFLVKAGTLIFALSLLIWAAQAVTPTLQAAADPSESLLGRIGQWVAPLLAPLGFGSWQAAVALLSGLVAKEAVVGSLTILYAGGNAALLPGMLAGAFTPASALAFLVFSLLYMPCISAFATIVREMGSLKWGLVSALLQCGAAYAVAFVVYRLAEWLL